MFSSKFNPKKKTLPSGGQIELWHVVPTHQPGEVPFSNNGSLSSVIISLHGKYDVAVSHDLSSHVTKVGVWCGGSCRPWALFSAGYFLLSLSGCHQYILWTGLIFSGNSLEVVLTFLEESSTFSFFLTLKLPRKNTELEILIYLNWARQMGYVCVGLIIIYKKMHNILCFLLLVTMAIVCFKFEQVWTFGKKWNDITSCDTWALDSWYTKKYNYIWLLSFCC